MPAYDPLTDPWYQRQQGNTSGSGTAVNIYGGLTQEQLQTLVSFELSQQGVMTSEQTDSKIAAALAAIDHYTPAEGQAAIEAALAASGFRTTAQVDAAIAAALSGYTPPAKTTQTASHTTASLAASASVDFPLTLAPSALLRRVELSTPGWLRLYRTEAARTADASRIVEVAPSGAGEAGLVLDVVLPYNSSQEMWLEGANAAAPTNTYYARLTNTDTVARAVTLSLSYLALE